MQARTIEITETACPQGTLLFVDAEQTYIQDALDGFTRQLQTKFHKDNKAFILNGYQCYLKSSIRHVRKEMARCRRLGIGSGLKLIRGAYMEEERKLAKEHNYESPVWDTIEDTHKAYDTNMTYVLKNLDTEKDYLLIGSHNRASCDLSKGIIIERGLTSNNVCFGQLKGFSDSLTFSLSEEGFNVLKYLPYGPTEYLIPYLIRRGHESKQVMREHLFLDDIKGEIKSRLNPKSYF